MPSRQGRVLLTLVMLVLMAAPAAWGQTQIIRQVIGSGAVAAAGPQGLIAGTIGQTIIGRSSSSSHLGYLGFWYTYPAGNGPTSVREEHASAVTGASASVRVAPNPVVDLATVSIALPTSGEIKLAVFDGIGQERIMLIDGWRNAGTVTVQVPARDLESGDYLLVLIANGTRTASPMRVIH